MKGSEEHTTINWCVFLGNTVITMINRKFSILLERNNALETLRTYILLKKSLCYVSINMLLLSETGAYFS